MNLIRKNLTPSLGKDHGRVVLKSAKPLLLIRLTEFRAKLIEHQTTVAKELQKHLDDSRTQVVDYYKARVVESLGGAVQVFLGSGGDVLELSVAETADLLDISEGSVKTHTHRGLQALQQRIEVAR